jgi:DNA-binding MarR family transcriptional regulator
MFHRYDQGMPFKKPGKPATWPEVRTWRTLFRAHSHIWAEHKNLEKSLGLSLTQLDLLLALGNREGTRMGDLASMLITSPANVTRLCVSLEKKGLVKRQRSEESDRVVLASLTEEGDRLFKEYFPKTANFTQEIIASALTEKECVELSDLLDKLLKAKGPDLA